MLRTSKKLLALGVTIFLIAVWLSYRYIQSVDQYSNDVSNSKIKYSNENEDLSQLDLFNFTGNNLLSYLNFTNTDGGSWKQGWPVSYDRNLLTDLEVFIMPHSHLDVGWVKTIDQYYEYVKAILDNIISLIEDRPDRRFVWSEVVFLQMWWDDKATSDSQRSTLKNLIQTGKIEVLTGGWVVPDEASTSYESIVDQLILGHQWLQQQIGQIEINCSFPMDIFGTGSAMVEILPTAGIHNLAIHRIHYIIKKALAKEKSLEFLWGKEKILTHMEPFYSYDIPHTCGPEPEVCCAFDFERLLSRNCPWRYQPTRITGKNVHSQATLLVDQYRKKASLYNFPVLLIPLGDDFRYKNPNSALTQFESYERLINYINTRPEWKIKIKFGTLNEYFEALRKHIGETTQLRNFHGDFFPYADKDQEYWTGYFVSRPHLKSIAKEMQTLLRTAEILRYFAHNDLNQSTDLISARRINAIMQHHDTITGTSPNEVTEDVMIRVKQFYSIIKSALEIYVSSLSSNVVTPIFSCSLDASEGGCDNMPVLSFQSRNSIRLQLFNSLEQNVQQLVRIRLDSSVPLKVLTNNKPVEHQISSFTEYGRLLVELSFVADVSPLTFQIYEILPDDSPEKATVYNANVFGPDTSEIKISNNNYEMTLNDAGVIQLNERNSAELLASVQIVQYSGLRHLDFAPGSYLANIGYNDVPINFDQLFVLRGPVYSSIRLFKQKLVMLELILINGQDLSKALHVKSKTNLVGINENFEIAMRLVSPQKFENIFTDTNGLHMTLRKRNPHLPGQANIYPFTTTVEVVCKKRRLTVLSGQSRSVYIRPDKDDTLDFILHRVTSKDDNRGMGEALIDNYPASHEFIILPDNTASNKHLIHPLQKFTVQTERNSQNPIQLIPSISDYRTAHIVSIVNLDSHRILVVLRRIDETVSLDNLFKCRRYYRCSVTGSHRLEDWKSCISDPLHLEEPLTSVIMSDQ